MKFDQQIVDRVQSGNDIVEIIGQYLTLKRSGRNLKACCPFHQEKTPSFMVNPEKQIFHCFGCSAGGDVFSFLMRHENMTFPEALRQLAERAGITLPEYSSKQGEGPSENERLYEIYRYAMDFYHAQYKDPVKGKMARDYFQKRGFEAALADELKMGWAPEGWRNLFDFLSKKGFQESILLKSALVMRSPKGNLYDTFRERLLFPIANLQGKIMAFGGRLVRDVEGPKYLNSPENPVFQKRRELFGLYLAKKHIDRDLPRILVVEGYFDFLRLYQYGFKATVATLGTSLTEDHVQVLKRFAQEAVVVYDGDKAGEAAALRGLEVFLEGGMNVKIARVPAGYDPDDFVLKQGAEAFQKVLEEARDFFDFKLEVMLSRFNRADSLGLIRITNEFMETFSKIQNPVLTERYLRKLAGALGVDENSLRTELIKLRKKQEKIIPRQPLPLAPAAIKREEIGPDELLLLAVAIEDASLRKELLLECEESDFADPELRGIYQYFANLEASGSIEARAAGPSAAWAKIFNRLTNPVLKENLTKLSAMNWDSDQRQKAFTDCLAQMRLHKSDKKLEQLRRSIAKAEREGDQSGLETLMQEYHSLWKQSRVSP